MISHRVLSSTQIVFLFIWLFFLSLLLNGYALNLLGMPADARALATLAALAFVAGIIFARRASLRLTRAPLDLAGFLLVCVAAFVYFLGPTLPGALPPAYSGDPALHLNFTNSVYATGRIINGDPGGPSLIAATLAHWLGQSPVRVLHPLAALWLALTAGAIYGAARALLPDRAESTALALCAPFALFALGDYFAGIAMGAHYFFSQIAGQFFIAAFIWFGCEYARTRDALWQMLSALALLALLVLYQLWIIFPATLFAYSLFADWRRGNATRRRALGIAAIAGALGIGAVAVIFLNQPQFIPALERLKIDGAVIPPSFEALGGWLLILPAFGMLMSRRDRGRAQMLWALTIAALAQTGALGFAQIAFGAGKYWFYKTFFLWIFPLALWSAFGAAQLFEIARRKFSLRRAPAFSFAVVFILLASFVYFFKPPHQFIPISNSDLRVALWAREHLDTRQINLLGPKSLLAQWIGIGLWGEALPEDLFVDLARLGPRTFEEWRGDAGWGDYLLASSAQYVPRDPSLAELFRDGDSALYAKPPANAPPLAAPRGNFGDTFAITNYKLPRTSFYPGETLAITAQILPRRVPAAQVIWRAQLRDRAGNAFADARILPFGDKFALQRWSPGKMQNETLLLPLSPEIPPGIYDLQLGLYRVRTGAALPFVNDHGAPDDVLHLGSIKIYQLPITDHYLSAFAPLDARIGNVATLLGYRIIKQSPIRPGGQIRVELIWRAEQRGAADYNVFAQLLDARGQLIAQRDSAPRAGAYPTSIWERGEVIADAYTLTIPRDADAGAHRVIVGMYAFPSLARLPVSDARDYVELPSVIQIESRE